MTSVRSSSTSPSQSSCALQRKWSVPEGMPCSGSCYVQNAFQQVSEVASYPLPLESSVISSVPKKAVPSILNDYHPVVLTSFVMMCFERLVLHPLLQHVGDHMNPLQFAYLRNRGVEDADLTICHSVYTHLEKPKSLFTFSHLSTPFRHTS